MHAYIHACMNVVYLFKLQSYTCMHTQMHVCSVLSKLQSYTYIHVVYLSTLQSYTYMHACSLLIYSTVLYAVWHS